MSRSVKKAFYIISKKWDSFKERRYRARIKNELRRVEREITFDPDADFEAAMGPDGIADWGTRFGLEYCNDEYWQEERVIARRK